jgi:hypothetical protein
VTRTTRRAHARAPGTSHVHSRARAPRSVPPCSRAASCSFDPSCVHHYVRTGTNMLHCCTALAMALLSSAIAVGAVPPASSMASSSQDRYLRSLVQGRGYHMAIDDMVVQDRGTATPSLGPVRKSDANPLLREDQQWEGSWKNTNPSVVYKDGVFHLWMTANLVCPGASPTNPHDTCAHPGYNYTVPKTAHRDGGLLYARSTDGVHFQKPNLGLVEVFGSTQNNIVYRTGGGPAQTGVFFDEHAQVFRMFGKDFGIEMGQEVGVASSFDGIHNWTNFTPAASMGLAHGADTRCGTNSMMIITHMQSRPQDLNSDGARLMRQ